MDEQRAVASVLPTRHDGKAHIDRLPSELLADIFHRVTVEAYCTIDEQSGLRPPHPTETISIVCRHWHAVVFSTPAVWSYLWFKWHPLYSKHQAELHIQLSGASLMTIDIAVCDDGVPRSSRAPKSKASKSGSKSKSAKSNVAEPNWSWEEIHAWLHRIGPRLRHLDLRCCHWATDMVFQVPSRATGEGEMERLRSVTYHCTTLPYADSCMTQDQLCASRTRAGSINAPTRSWSTPNLDTLSMYNPSDEQLLRLDWVRAVAPHLRLLRLGPGIYGILAEQYDFLRCCRELEELELVDTGQFASRPTPGPGPAVVLLANLRKLIVRHRDHSIDWLWGLHCPSLETLELRAYRQGKRFRVADRTLHDAFDHILHDPVLASIRVADLGFPTATRLGTFLRRLPNVQDLKIQLPVRYRTDSVPADDNGWEGIASAFLPNAEAGETGFRPLPHLEKLSWRIGSQDADVLKLMPNMLMRRATIGGIIPTVRVTMASAGNARSIMGDMLGKAGYSIRARHQGIWSAIEGWRDGMEEGGEVIP